MTDLTSSEIDVALPPVLPALDTGTAPADAVAPVIAGAGGTGDGGGGRGDNTKRPEQFRKVLTKETPISSGGLLETTGDKPPQLGELDNQLYGVLEGIARDLKDYRNKYRKTLRLDEEVFLKLYDERFSKRESGAHFTTNEELVTALGIIETEVLQRGVTFIDKATNNGEYSYTVTIPEADIKGTNTAESWRNQYLKRHGGWIARCGSALTGGKGVHPKDLVYSITAPGPKGREAVYTDYMNKLYTDRWNPETSREEIETMEGVRYAVYAKIGLDFYNEAEAGDVRLNFNGTVDDRTGLPTEGAGIVRFNNLRANILGKLIGEKKWVDLSDAEHFGWRLKSYEEAVARTLEDEANSIIQEYESGKRIENISEIRNRARELESGQGKTGSYKEEDEKKAIDEEAEAKQTAKDLDAYNRRLDELEKPGGEIAKKTRAYKLAEARFVEYQKNYGNTIQATSKEIERLNGEIAERQVKLGRAKSQEKNELTAEISAKQKELIPLGALLSTYTQLQSGFDTAREDLTGDILEAGIIRTSYFGETGIDTSGKSLQYNLSLPKDRSDRAVKVAQAQAEATRRKSKQEEIHNALEGKGVASAKDLEKAKALKAVADLNDGDKNYNLVIEGFGGNDAYKLLIDQHTWYTNILHGVFEVGFDPTGISRLPLPRDLQEKIVTQTDVLLVTLDYANETPESLFTEVDKEIVDPEDPAKKVTIQVNPYTEAIQEIHTLQDTISGMRQDAKPASDIEAEEKNLAAKKQEVVVLLRPHLNKVPQLIATRGNPAAFGRMLIDHIRNKAVNDEVFGASYTLAYEGVAKGITTKPNKPPTTPGTQTPGPDNTPHTPGGPQPGSPEAPFNLPPLPPNGEAALSVNWPKDPTISYTVENVNNAHANLMMTIHPPEKPGDPPKIGYELRMELTEESYKALPETLTTPDYPEKAMDQYYEKQADGTWKKKDKAAVLTDRFALVAEGNTDKNQLLDDVSRLTPDIKDKLPIAVYEMVMSENRINKTGFVVDSIPVVPGQTVRFNESRNEFVLDDNTTTIQTFLDKGILEQDYGGRPYDELSEAEKKAVDIARDGIKRRLGTAWLDKMASTVEPGVLDVAPAQPTPPPADTPAQPESLKQAEAVVSHGKATYLFGSEIPRAEKMIAGPIGYQYKAKMEYENEAVDGTSVRMKLIFFRGENDEPMYESTWEIKPTQAYYDQLPDEGQLDSRGNSYTNGKPTQFFKYFYRKERDGRYVKKPAKDVVRDKYTSLFVTSEQSLRKAISVDGYNLPHVEEAMSEAVFDMVTQNNQLDKNKLNVFGNDVPAINQDVRFDPSSQQFMVGDTGTSLGDYMGTQSSEYQLKIKQQIGFDWLYSLAHQENPVPLSATPTSSPRPTFRAQAAQVLGGIGNRIPWRRSSSPTPPPPETLGRTSLEETEPLEKVEYIGEATVYRGQDNVNRAKYQYRFGENDSLEILVNFHQGQDKEMIVYRNRPDENIPGQSKQEPPRTTEVKTLDELYDAIRTNTVPLEYYPRAIGIDLLKEQSKDRISAELMATFPQTSDVLFNSNTYVVTYSNNRININNQDAGTFIQTQSEEVQKELTKQIGHIWLQSQFTPPAVSTSAGTHLPTPPPPVDTGAPAVTKSTGSASTEQPAHTPATGVAQEIAVPASEAEAPKQTAEFKWDYEGVVFRNWDGATRVHVVTERQDNDAGHSFSLEFSPNRITFYMSDGKFPDKIHGNTVKLSSLEELYAKANLSQTDRDGFLTSVGYNLVANNTSYKDGEGYFVDISSLEPFSSTIGEQNYAVSVQDGKLIINGQGASQAIKGVSASAAGELQKQIGLKFLEYKFSQLPSSTPKNPAASAKEDKNPTKPLEKPGEKILNERISRSYVQQVLDKSSGTADYVGVVYGLGEERDIQMRIPKGGRTIYVDQYQHGTIVEDNVSHRFTREINKGYPINIPEGERVGDVLQREFGMDDAQRAHFMTAVGREVLADRTRVQTADRLDLSLFPEVAVTIEGEDFHLEHYGKNGIIIDGQNAQMYLDRYEKKYRHVKKLAPEGEMPDENIKELERIKTKLLGQIGETWLDSHFSTPSVSSAQLGGTPPPPPVVESETVVGEKWASVKGDAYVHIEKNSRQDAIRVKFENPDNSRAKRRVKFLDVHSADNTVTFYDPEDNHDIPLGSLADLFKPENIPPEDKDIYIEAVGAAIVDNNHTDALENRINIPTVPVVSHTIEGRTYYIGVDQGVVLIGGAPAYETIDNIPPTLELREKIQKALRWQVGDNYLKSILPAVNVEATAPETVIASTTAVPKVVVEETAQAVEKTEVRPAESLWVPPQELLSNSPSYLILERYGQGQGEGDVITIRYDHTPQNRLKLKRYDLVLRIPDEKNTILISQTSTIGLGNSEQVHNTAYALEIPISNVASEVLGEQLSFTDDELNGLIANMGENLIDYSPPRLISRLPRSEVMIDDEAESVVVQYNQESKKIEINNQRPGEFFKRKREAYLRANYNGTAYSDLNTSQFEDVAGYVNKIRHKVHMHVGTTWFNSHFAPPSPVEGPQAATPETVASTTALPEAVVKKPIDVVEKGATETRGIENEAVIKKREGKAEFHRSPDDPNSWKLYYHEPQEIDGTHVFMGVTISPNPKGRGVVDVARSLRVTDKSKRLFTQGAVPGLMDSGKLPLWVGNLTVTPESKSQEIIPSPNPDEVSGAEKLLEVVPDRDNFLQAVGNLVIIGSEGIDLSGIGISRIPLPDLYGSQDNSANGIKVDVRTDDDNKSHRLYIDDLPAQEFLNQFDDNYRKKLGVKNNTQDIQDAINEKKNQVKRAIGRTWLDVII